MRTHWLKLFWPRVRLCSRVDKLEPSDGLIAVTPCFTGQRLQNVLWTLSWKKAPPAHLHNKHKINILVFPDNHTNKQFCCFINANILYDWEHTFVIYWSIFKFFHMNIHWSDCSKLKLQMLFIKTKKMITTKQTNKHHALADIYIRPIKTN